jgi:hypothetical protein
MPPKPNDLFWPSLLILIAAWQAYEHFSWAFTALFLFGAVACVWSGYGALKAYSIAKLEFELAAERRRLHWLEQQEESPAKSECAQRIKKLEAAITQFNYANWISDLAVGAIRLIRLGPPLCVIILVDKVFEHSPGLSQLTSWKYWSGFQESLWTIQKMGIVYGFSYPLKTPSAVVIIKQFNRRVRRCT